MNEVALEPLIEEELAKLVFPSTPPAPRWSITATRGDTSTHIKIRDESGSFDSYQSRTFVRFSYHHASNNVVFENICLRNNLRGKKAGRALVELVENIATRVGADEIRLDSVEPDAVGFWEHLGYAQDDDWEYRKHFRSSG